MALWWGAAGWHDGASTGAIAATVGATILSAAVALGILAVSGVLMARGTVYSLTSRRLVIRHGVAMPMAINIPFSKIDSASLSEGRRGFGNVAFMPHARSRTSYVALWPHARPWQVIRPEPTLRCIADAAAVAHLAAQALAADAGHTSSKSTAASKSVAATTLASRPIRSSANAVRSASSTTPVLS
jgi:Bacterial PH domain